MLNHESGLRKSVRRMWIGGLAAVAAVAISLTVLRIVTQSPSATLINPRFEEAGSPPPGWLLDPEAASKGEVTVVNAPTAEGQRALRLAPNARNQGGAKSLGVGQLLSAEAVRDRFVTLSAAVAGQGGAVAVVGIAVLDRSGQIVAQTSLRSSSPPPLTQKSVRLDEAIPTSARSLIVYVIAEGRSGEAFVDDIALRTEAPQAPEPPTGTAFRATVTVDLDRQVAPVRRHLFGTNVEWIRNAQGLWNPTTQSLDRDIVELAKQAGITLVRFPGGGWSDAYDWRDGVGPQAQRPRRPHAPGDKESSPNVIGTDEIIDFARRIGADLLLTLNLGRGTPDMAADWGRYVRRAIGAQGSPRVIWELGNELYMKDDVSGGSMSPGTYVERARSVIEAVRAVDPAARIYAIGLQNYGRYRFNHYDDWNEKVLQGLAGRIDGLAIHNAYAPLLPGATEGSPAAVYRAMLAAPANIAANLDATTRQLEAVKGGAPLSLAVTEWGPLFAVDPHNPYFDHVKTLGSAVFVARTLNVFLRAPRVAAANFFKLSDLLNVGWIGRKPSGGYAATPSLEVLRLYSTYLAGDLLETKVAGPSFGGGPIGFTDRVEKTPTIDAVAAQRPDGLLTVIVSNASLDASATVDLPLPSPYSAEIELVTGASPDAHRGTGMISVPGLSFAEPARFGAPRPPGVDQITIATTHVAGAPVTVLLPPTSVAAVRLRPEE